MSAKADRLKLNGRTGLMNEMTRSARSAHSEISAHRAERFNTRICNAVKNASAIAWRGGLMVAILSSYTAGAQVSQPSQSSIGSEYTFKLNANLVILNATVLDSRNVLVSGLKKDDFQVYEDGVLQQIKHFSHEDTPITAGILVDNSGSMASKRADVIAAALAFAQSSNPEDQMFIVNFNNQVSFGLPADKPFTDRPDQLQSALLNIKAIGGTALYDSVAAGLEHLKQGNREKKVLILISDGGENASEHSYADVIEMAKFSEATIYAIGIFGAQDGDQNPGVLRRLAMETGGEVFFPASSRDIVPICAEIARNIRNEYTLAYVPTSARDVESYRVIKVKANEPGLEHLSVRTRAGYSVRSATTSVATR